MYVYIIYAPDFDIFYKGVTTNPDNRIWEHNNESSRYTAEKGLWELVYSRSFSNKRDALIDLAGTFTTYTS